MHPPIEDAEKFETYVKYIYEELLDIEGERVQVAWRSKMRGRSGSWYEVDVYYSFENAGVRHGVAFECKYWRRPVDRDAVVAFHGKLQDIGDVHGIMVSKEGFQRGARDYAEHYGIELMGLEELPSLLHVLRRRIGVLLPDASANGEPFWVLMTREGNYWCMGNEDPPGMGLFISKADALAFHEVLGDDEWGVFGMPRRALKIVVNLARRRGRLHFGICPHPPEPGERWSFITQTPDEISQRFIDV